MYLTESYPPLSYPVMSSPILSYPILSVLSTLAHAKLRKDQATRKKRPQDAADEQSAKRACVAPSETAQQDDDCVFVKVTTLAERDAIGRANAIVLD